MEERENLKWEDKHGLHSLKKQLLAVAKLIYNSSCQKLWSRKNSVRPDNVYLILQKKPFEHLKLNQCSNLLVCLFTPSTVMTFDSPPVNKHYINCITLIQDHIQLLNSDYIRLLNKPYENEVTLTWQNPPLKCC